ncbi:Hypothetical protein NTJ_05602 [Nesidiocoris tenuis]|uniref:Uncharacterized protein n=1 Tax=Nesidiocoris tenuis TaxID=355587 RepID=A0ABN7AL74_9HEMI|nr:Hypothetical protein NTJ_05602 [Nesidiocoris tenuis]
MAHSCQKEYLIESTLKGPICLPVSDGLSSEGNLLIFLDRKRVTSKAEGTLNILQDSRKGNDESAEGEKAAALPPGTSIPQESSARRFRFYPSITQLSPATQNSIWAIYLRKNGFPKLAILEENQTLVGNEGGDGIPRFLHE